MNIAEFCCDSCCGPGKGAPQFEMAFEHLGAFVTLSCTRQTELHTCSLLRQSIPEMHPDMQLLFEGQVRVHGAIPLRPVPVSPAEPRARADPAADWRELPFAPPGAGLDPPGDPGDVAGQPLGAWEVNAKVALHSWRNLVKILESLLITPASFLASCPDCLSYHVEFAIWRC